MTKESALTYFWQDGKLINVGLSFKDADANPPTTLDLEIFRIFKEHQEQTIRIKELEDCLATLRDTGGKEDKELIDKVLK